MVATAEKKRRKRASRPQPRTPGNMEAPKVQPSPLDGWEWLKRPPKQDGKTWRLTERQTAAGDHWRKLYRDHGNAPPVRSCLNIVEGRGGGHSASLPILAEAMTDAKLQLDFLRLNVLMGHSEMIDVMDSVCGRGLTLLEMNGGNSRAALQSEKALKIALDLLASGGMRRAA